MGLADHSSICDGQHSMAQRLLEPSLSSDLFRPVLTAHLAPTESHPVPPSPSWPASPGADKDETASVPQHPSPYDREKGRQ